MSSEISDFVSSSNAPITRPVESDAIDSCSAFCPIPLPDARARNIPICFAVAGAPGSLICGDPFAGWFALDCAITGSAENMSITAATASCVVLNAGLKSSITSGGRSFGSSCATYSSSAKCDASSFALANASRSCGICDSLRSARSIFADLAMCSWFKPAVLQASTNRLMLSIDTNGSFGLIGSTFAAAGFGAGFTMGADGVCDTSSHSCLVHNARHTPKRIAALRMKSEINSLSRSGLLCMTEPTPKRRTPRMVSQPAMCAIPFSTR